MEFFNQYQFNLACGIESKKGGSKEDGLFLSRDYLITQN